jgi:hypothetical protein
MIAPISDLTLQDTGILFRGENCDARQDEAVYVADSYGFWMDQDSYFE